MKALGAWVVALAAGLVLWNFSRNSSTVYSLHRTTPWCPVSSQLRFLHYDESSLNPDIAIRVINSVGVEVEATLEPGSSNTRKRSMAVLRSGPKSITRAKVLRGGERCQSQFRLLIADDACVPGGEESGFDPVEKSLQYKHQKLVANGKSPDGNRDESVSSNHQDTRSRMDKRKEPPSSESKNPRPVATTRR